ncbi:MAG: ATP-grasp domain-containing protein [Bacteroidota bacterium]
MIKVHSKKPVAIILGGTFPHITLINKLKSRGFYTILVDYYKNPIAQFSADIHVQQSTLDKKKVLEIAKETQAKLVISSCVDQANATACFVAEKLNLPLPYSYEVATNVTDKYLMKKMMLENNIPTSNFITINDFNKYKEGRLNYPLIVKPTDSNSSKGVRRADNINELKEYFLGAQKISRNNFVIIEEFKFGTEVGVDCFISKNEASILMTRERKKIKNGGDAIQQIFGSFWPADISTENLKKLKQIASKIAKVFQLDHTPLLIQAIVAEDEINVIEFAPRIGGGENYKIIELHTKFDIIESAIKSFLGEPVKLDYTPPEGYIVDNYIYCKPSIFGKITGYEELIKNGVIEYFNTYKLPGMEIGSDIASSNRVGVFVVKSEDKEDIYKKIKQTIESIEVYDDFGKPIMRKDIY